ncbi:MAG: hypothetical protein U1F68_01440 [Gammaproteobacteria bacterium]
MRLWDGTGGFSAGTGRDISASIGGIGGFSSATLTLQTSVTAVNDVPSFTKGPNQTDNEDAGVQTVSTWATNLSRGPVNEVGQTLSFQATGNTNAALFAVAPAVSPSGTLSYTPAANANGSATISLVIKDNGGTTNGGVDTSAPQTFTITVLAVNDPRASPKARTRRSLSTPGRRASPPGRPTSAVARPTRWGRR